MIRLATICHHLEQLAPPRLAAEWDNVGLLLGDPSQEVRRVMACLSVTPTVVDEAVAEQVDLIVTHHPILFRGTKRLTAQEGDGRLLWPLARSGIGVYSPHTAWDNAAGGINDGLARRLGLVDVRPLRRHPASPQVKLVVFVPDNDLERVADAVFKAGAGIIGRYEQCSFRLSGIGTFFGTEETNPTVGQKGRREQVPEWRLEVVCPESRLSEAVAAMRQAHSYEEPAFDLYPLRSLPGLDGEGRIGTLPTPCPLHELAQRTREVLSARTVQYVGQPDRLIRQVALACGAGGDYLADAAAAGADLFLTGEARFHDYLRAEQRGLALILPGHFASERPGVEDLADRLQRDFPALQVWASRRETDPGRWV